MLLLILALLGFALGLPNEIVGGLLAIFFLREVA